jgi:hypothetical protein
MAATHPSVEGFWKFCSLRQEAYWLRQRGEKHPDPAFRYHFCNVYREADRGTLWFRDELRDKGLLHGDLFEKLNDLVWYAVAYRLVNRLDTFKDWGTLPGRTDKDRWLRFLKERMVGGHKVFTGRHLNVGFAKYAAALDWLDENLLDVSREIREALYLQRQVTCDLMESPVGLPSVSDADRWVHLGPGAWNALKLIYPDVKRSESVEWAVKLWQTQARHTMPSMEKCWDCDGTGRVHSHNDICDTCDRSIRGGRFVMDPPPQAPGPMSLKNVEHALCEYARYVRVITTPEGKGVGLEVKKW